ncbi:hypothetical protein DACRYDRAFT_74849 [Dacryopinax primogenitus]|uniref:Uncharacterized protein n=1 Tax=Dacryopinax primogenitus (strain DJM 731) TaxID=1858805 RepID=M5GEP7_DACPD|nr:uncharacterized protein DACRYDRAFT_74849 [Dacryopinax primogenitus]EJU05587.1 hypothetical protein DACRYDRAFT_74849 [Dacryopinax primogenitus]
MALASTRPVYMTLVHGEMETIRILPKTYGDLEVVARDWLKPPEGTAFALRVPTDMASWAASRVIQGPWIWIGNDETWQIATQGIPGIRVEIVSDAAAPPPDPPPRPPTPVLEMPATFNLELDPGQTVALETWVTSEEYDMSKTDDNIMVDGTFYGKLSIVHKPGTHTVDFTGTRYRDPGLQGDFWMDASIMRRLALVSKQQSVARCQATIMAPSPQYCDFYITMSNLWRLGVTFPQAEILPDGRAKFFIRTANKNGYLEHFHTETVVTSLYYEVTPEVGVDGAASYVKHWNGSFAVPFDMFIPHLYKILDSVGVPVKERTNFICNNINAFSHHKTIAFRLMSPKRLSSAIDISVTTDPSTCTRVFLLWRGLPDDELPLFDGRGAKEAAAFDWRDEIGWTEAALDAKNFRILELSIMECI